MNGLSTFVYILSILLSVHCDDDSFTISKVDLDNFSIAKDRRRRAKRRYLLYDVNPGEGFNLRRDVHMRVANLVRLLREKGHNFVLVLPPFGQSYHWQETGFGKWRLIMGKMPETNANSSRCVLLKTRELREKQQRIPWGLFFDLPSLNRHVPSIEFEQYLEETGQMGKEARIEQVFYLQHYAEGWGEGGWKEKWHYRPCIEAEGRYYQFDDEAKVWRGFFWGYGYEVGAVRMDCISVMGQGTTVANIVLQSNISHFQSIMIDRAETFLHDYFGDKHYWNARRSMRYSKDLIALADEFRKTELESDDEADGTVIPDEDWTKVKVRSGEARGGPYLGVHWRRKDFLRSHKKDIPSVQGTADQIKSLLNKLGLDTVFIGTDGKPSEVEELRKLLGSEIHLKQYVPPKEILQKYLDGGVAIIDQWILAHARYFIGSHVSTFSYRVQDEREILGFDPDSTFRRLCPDDDADCEQPAKWRLKTD